MDTDMLAEMFEDEAEWRDRKASEYPDDTRNKEASEELRRLSRTCTDVPAELLTAAEELYEDAPDIEEWNEMMRQIGFSRYPKTAEEFLREFVASRTS